jgi:hypothetical protein
LAFIYLFIVAGTCITDTGCIFLMWILSACRDDANVFSTTFGETMTAANRRRYHTVHRKAGNAHVLLICVEQAKVGVTFVYNASLQ